MDLKLLNLIKESEEKYRFIVENSPDGIFIMDFKGNILSVNPIVCEELGYSEEELLKMNFCDLVPPKYIPQWKERIKKLIKGEVLNIPAEYEVIDKEGKIHWIEVRSTPIKKENKIIGFLGVARDVTEKKQIEEKFKREHELLQTLIENIPDSIYFKDKDNKFILVNKAKASHHNTTPENMIGKTDFDFLPEDEARNAWKDDDYVKNTKKPIVGKIERITRADGKKYWLSVTKIPLIDEKGEVRGTIGISRDITEAKKAEENIKLQKAYFQSLFENSPEAIVTLNVKGLIKDVNKKFTELFGFTPEEVKGKDLNELIVPEELMDEALKLDKKALKEIVSAETIRKKKDGTKFPVSILGAPIYIDKKVVGYYAIYRDLTEEKRMEEELIQSERLSTLGQLIAGIAHELNNPLTSVIGYSEFILSSKMEGKDLMDRLKKIKEEADRCFRIVQDLLDIARYHPPEKDYADLNTTIDKAIQITEYEMKLDNIEVIREFDYSIPLIKINEHRIQQAILNLLINAHEALLNKKGDREIRIKTKKDNNKVIIEISDNGPGIPKENLGKIFLPFFTTKRGIKKGIGLGLSMVQKIVHEHEGNIFVLSEEGKGATFKIVLPCF